MPPLPPRPIAPLPGPLAAEIRVPGSKSISNRALVLAALTATREPVTLDNLLASDDTAVMIDGLRRLGFVVTEDPATVFRPTPRGLPATSADLFLGNSGTSMRFLTAVAALGNGTYRLDGVPRMRERPIRDLLDGLGQLGVRATSEAGTGCPPVVIHAAGLPGGRVAIKSDVSSQFLSALLMAAPFARDTLGIDLVGEISSEPYIDMTVAMMREFGLDIHRPTPREFVVPPHGGGQALTRYAVEPDASGASYFWAAAAVCGGRVVVPGLTRSSLQGDVKFVDALAAMGCTVDESPAGIGVTGGRLRGITIDMNGISDTVMTLAAVACFADGPTVITNVRHIRHKETDRIHAVCTELAKLGARVTDFPDGLRIDPRPLRGVPVDTYDDHRMAMSLSLVGLRVPGVEIKDPGCVAKTYPGYWEDFERLRG